jgi:hypothetical protein
MFSNKDTAVKVNMLMVEYTAKLSASLKQVRDECTPEEFQTYKIAIGKLMGYAFTDVAGPIYEQYPDLMSDNLKAAKEEYFKTKVGGHNT